MATRQTVCYIAVCDLCDTVDDKPHRTAHEEAGKTISACAMTVTFA